MVSETRTKFTTMALHALVIAGSILVMFVVTLLLSGVWTEIGSSVRKALIHAGLSDRTVAYISLVCLTMIPDAFGYFLGGLFCGICLKRKWWVSALIAGLLFLIFQNIVHSVVLGAVSGLINQGERSFSVLNVLNFIKWITSPSLALLGSAIPSIVRRSRRRRWESGGSPS
jgi:hypothetical protein